MPYIVLIVCFIGMFWDEIKMIIRIKKKKEDEIYQYKIKKYKTDTY